MPQKITPSILMQILQRPKWAAATASRGKPEFSNLTKYVNNNEIGDIYTFVEIKQQKLCGSDANGMREKVGVVDQEGQDDNSPRLITFR